MINFWTIQAFYCLSGIGFFIQDLFAKVPMGDAMVRAFIWPYAQKDRIADFFTGTMMGYLNDGIAMVTGFF
ncbi:MAG: hypothetical protein GKS03_03430 [Alphaproteobacteria bacterium]|nr:hypothetical protein [Alphaproteobacteria bacterium]